MDEARFLEELKKDFFEEAKLLIDSLEKNVLILEGDPSSKGAIDEVFRSVHTLKGGAATLDFDRIVNLTHVMEDLLDELRSDKLALESDTIDLLLEGIDVIKVLVESGELGEVPTKGIEDRVIEAIKAKYVGVGAEEISSESASGGVILQEEKAFKLSKTEEELVRGSVNGGYNIYKIVIKIKDRSLRLDEIEDKIKDLYMRLCDGGGKLLRALPEVVAGLGVDMAQRRECLLQSSKDISSVENLVQGELDWLELEDIYKYTKDDLLGEKDVVEQEIEGLEVSNETLEIIYDFITSGKRVYKLLVSFKEDNPMRSLSGLLFYNVLSTNAQILQGMPSYEELRKTNYFYKTNEYIVGSNLEIKELHRKIYISEVTSKIRFMEYKQTSDEKSYYADREADEISNVLESDRVGREFEKEEVKERREQHLLRVDSAKVDMLLNFVGELVIVKGSLSQVNVEVLEELNNFTNMFVEHRRGLIDLSQELVRLDNIYASGDVLGEREVLENVMGGGFGARADNDGYTEGRGEESNLANRFKQLRNKVEELYKNIGYAGIYFRSVHDKLKGVSQSVDRVTDDLQEGVMSIRMIPISQVFSRLPRLVRDISRVLKKEVSLVMQGEGTQLDKSVVQDLLDSLLHIIRNAVDHGIELPEERQAKGKPIKGTINLKAEHQGNTILITVKDDGRGISLSEIKKRAREKQLFGDRVELTKSDVLELLYKPGFTTSKTVSSISGRGVGMDVVRKKIEGLSGSVAIDSKEGEWTEFSLKIPLTLVIIKALLIRLSENIYSISISAVVETARVSSKDIESKEELTSYVTIRGVRYIYVNLCKLFDLSSKPEEKDYRYIVIVNIRGRHVALSADALEGEQDIVIKPLKSKYTNVSGITGATILGDGQVSLVLDVAGIFGEMEEKIKLRV